MKTLFSFIVFYTMISLQSFCQNASGYFIPKSTSMLSNVVYNDSITGKMEYKVINDTCFIITEKNYLKGTEYTDIEETFRIYKDTILIKSFKREMVGGTNTEFNFKKDNIYFILPKKNMKAVWHYSDMFGDNFTCTSEFTQIKYKNNMCNAVKITAVDKKNHDTEIHYYIENIGFYKTEMQDEKNKNKWEIWKIITD